MSFRKSQCHTDFQLANEATQHLGSFTTSEMFNRFFNFAVIVIRGLVVSLDCLNNQYHVVLSCVRAPLDVGIFRVSCALCRLPNVGQGHNEHDSLCNC